VLLRRASQVVEDDARLHPGGPGERVDLQDPRHVPPGVEHDGDVARLAGQARPRPAGQDRRVVLGAHPQGRHHVLVVEREDDPQWHLPVVGRVGGVDGPGRAIEADLAANRQPERRLQVSASRLGDGRAIDPSARFDDGHGTEPRPSPADRASSCRA
jgi:hypothetical protein